MSTTAPHLVLSLPTARVEIRFGPVFGPYAWLVSHKLFYAGGLRRPVACAYGFGCWRGRRLRERGDAGARIEVAAARPSRATPTGRIQSLGVHLSTTATRAGRCPPATAQSAAPGRRAPLWIPGYRRRARACRPSRRRLVDDQGSSAAEPGVGPSAPGHPRPRRSVRFKRLRAGLFERRHGGSWTTEYIGGGLTRRRCGCRGGNRGLWPAGFAARPVPASSS